jgi:hypothetical protein
MLTAVETRNVTGVFKRGIVVEENLEEVKKLSMPPGQLSDLI